MTASVLSCLLVSSSHGCWAYDIEAPDPNRALLGLVRAAAGTGLRGWYSEVRVSPRLWLQVYMECAGRASAADAEKRVTLRMAASRNQSPVVKPVFSG